MKIWFDADNGPHVLIMQPLIKECQARGHNVLVTARDRTNTPELLDLYGIPHIIVGGIYRPGTIGRVTGTLGRALDLSRAIVGDRPDVSFGHGSRALPIASRIRGIPTVTMYDYEWVNATLFNLCCNKILLPEAIGEHRCREAGVSIKKVEFFSGYKEELYLGGLDIDPAVSDELGLDPGKVQVLLRPPATTAHYHNPEAEVILDAILDKVAKVEDLQLIYLSRTPDQLELLRQKSVAEVIVPKRVFDGPSLIAAMDLVISGGGTMTREAAIMGIPSYSFFRGRKGNVDQKLEDDGYLVSLSNEKDVASRLNIRKKKGHLPILRSEILVEQIVSCLLEVGE